MGFSEAEIIKSLLTDSKEGLQPIKVTMLIDTLDKKTGVEIEIKKEYTLKRKKFKFSKRWLFITGGFI